MNILIVSYEAWRDTNNGGNVLSNIFCAFPDAKIAQIYCSGEAPQNSVCQEYFQISDAMLLGASKGKELEKRDYSKDDAKPTDVVENRIKNRIPQVFIHEFLLIRECMWSVFNWKTKELERFVFEFKPDIIFAPCYSYFHVSKLALYVKSVAKCPMISYISDDNYSLKRVCISPSFWVNRLITRKWIRKLFAECSLVYTMTDMQKTEYESLLGCPMKVLCKSADFQEREKKTVLPIQLIYAGGLYLNRWKVLGKLSKTLEQLNETETKAQLHIFSNSKLNARKKTLLNDGRNSFLHEQVSYQDLMERYRSSDVAVHVESFDLKNRLITRLSFSTKIIDCMNSGCAILAIGPSDQAGISYLKENCAAICANDFKDLYSAIKELVENTGRIEEYAKRANQLGKKNHMKNEIEKQIRSDFDTIVSQSVCEKSKAIRN